MLRIARSGLLTSKKSTTTSMQKAFASSRGPNRFKKETAIQQKAPKLTKVTIDAKRSLKVASETDTTFHQIRIEEQDKRDMFRFTFGFEPKDKIDAETIFEASFRKS